MKTLYIAVIAGPDKGHVFQVIAGAPMLVGRSRHSDTQFTDMRISRVHCEIEWDDEIWITDHGGSGTFVNGMRVQEQQLKLGDVIQIGDTQPFAHSPRLKSRIPQRQRQRIGLRRRRLRMDSPSGKRYRVSVGCAGKRDACLGQDCRRSQGT